MNNNKKRFESMKGELLEGLNALDNREPDGSIIQESPKSSRAKKVIEKVVEENPANGLRTKRSYMLTDKQIEMVILLKAKLSGDDYSDIVGSAIEMYYKKIMEGKK